MTNKHIIKDIRISHKEYWNELEENRPKSIKEYSSNHLNYLKEKLNISDREYDGIIHKLETTEPMPNTELLNFIIEELEKQGLKWNGHKEIFEILIPNEEFEEYKKSWYQWRSQFVEKIAKDTIRQSIQERLKFPASLWNIPEVEQRKIIPLKVKDFLEKDESSTPIKNNLYQSDTTFRDPPINKEQKQFLANLKKVVNYEIEEILKKNMSFFEPLDNNQLFLIEVIPILHSKGLYQFLKEYVFPSLCYPYRETIKIRKLEITTLSNLKNVNYNKVSRLLNSLPEDSKEQILDKETMKASIFRKTNLSKENITKDELHNILIQIISYYYSIYIDKKPYNYYPAINLVYMLKLLEIIFPNSPENKKYNIEEIYKSVKSSIRTDIKKGGEPKYYATITNLEFCLILNKPNTDNQISDILEDLNPNIFLVERPLFQMKWFMNIIKNFSENNSLDRFNKIIDIFESYINFQ